MEIKIDTNSNFSSSFNNGILFEIDEDKYIIKKNKPFELLLNLSNVEDIKNNLKSNPQDILYFLYLNIDNIERILYNIDEIIYFDFDDKNSNYFLKINQEKTIIEKKNEMFFLFYLSLLIKNNRNLVNFSFSFGFINKIDSINNIDESNIFKNILISKIILELIDYYKSNQILEEKINIEEKNNLNKIIKDNNKIINNYINHFEIIGLEITQKDLKLKNIDLIYSEIINLLLKSKDYDSSHKIIEQLGLENINITKTIFNEISKNFSSNGSYINDYKLTTFDDLFDSKKIDFYYILFKFILKKSIYIYYIDFLNETRKTIIKIIHSKQNQIKDYNFKDKVIDIIKFFTNSDDDMKYINRNDSNLNSNLNINNGKNQIGYEPLENYSYIIKKLNSQRDGSSFGLNVETSQSTNERTEENQSNQNINQNIINKEEITDPLERESFKNRENKIHWIQIKLKIKFYLI